jgi:hypothetical protein
MDCTQNHVLRHDLTRAFTHSQTHTHTHTPPPAPAHSLLPPAVAPTRPRAPSSGTGIPPSCERGRKGVCGMSCHHQLKRHEARQLNRHASTHTHTHSPDVCHAPGLLEAVEHAEGGVGGVEEGHQQHAPAGQHGCDQREPQRRQQQQQLVQVPPQRARRLPAQQAHEYLRRGGEGRGEGGWLVVVVVCGRLGCT